jgi:hypothetical protein
VERLAGSARLLPGSRAEIARRLEYSSTTGSGENDLPSRRF